MRVNCARFDRIKTKNELKKRGEKEREEKRRETETLYDERQYSIVLRVIIMMMMYNRT